jgi:signal peptidase II
MESPKQAEKLKPFTIGAIIEFMRKHWFDYLFLFSIAAVLIGLDQWTKALVRANIPLGADWLPDGLSWLMPYARIRHWYNSGAAFGIFQNGNLFFTILAITIILLIIYYYPLTDRHDWWLRVAMALQLAGAGAT